jgi:hypothetical protein
VIALELGLMRITKVEGESRSFKATRRVRVNAETFRR